MFKEIINKLNLNEKAKILVVHQDDVGVSHGSNLAFEELCGRGFVTSGSFMVPCPWYSEIAEMCKNNKDLDLGIHLTLTSEYNYYKWRPLSKGDTSTGLVNKYGYFWSTVPEVEKYASKESVEKELRMQIETVLSDNINVSHLDCHMGTGLSPKFQDIYIKLSEKYAIPAIFPRSWDNYNDVCSSNEVKNKGLEEMLSVGKKNFNQKVISLENSKNFFIIDYFAMTPFASKNQNAQLIKNIIKDLKPGFTYLALHCNKPGDMEFIDPDQCYVRIEEYDLAKDKEFIKWIKSIENLHLLSMKKIRSLIFL